MVLWLGLVDPKGTGTVVPIEVRGPDGMTAERLRLGLPSLLDGRLPTALYAGALAIDDRAVLGLPPLLDGAVISVDVPIVSQGSPATGLWQLHVTSGRDCGQVYELGPGQHTVGRARLASIRIDDPDVSRLHARIDVDARGIRVHDLGSSNGSSVDTTPVDPVGMALTPGAVLRVGRSTLVLRLPGGAPAACTPDGRGHLGINRGPRVRSAPHQVEIRFPARPVAPDRGRLPLLGMLIPLALCLPLAAIQRAPAYLLLGLMSPAMMLASFVSHRRGGRRDHATRIREWQGSRDRAQARLTAALDSEIAARHRSLPDHAELITAVERPLASVWERRRHDEDFLTLRIGIGDVPSSVRVHDPDAGSEPSSRTLSATPMGIRLADVGVLGIAGATQAVGGLARALMGQVAAWHSPRDVRLTILAAEADRAQEWAWASQLPHVRAPSARTCRASIGLLGPGGVADRAQVRARVDELSAVLDDRAAVSPATSGTPAWSGPCHVLLLDGAERLRAVPGISRLLEHGPAVGIYAVCLDRSLPQLPVECQALLALDPPGTHLSMLPAPTSDGAPIIVDAVSASWADRCGQALARLSDATPSEGLGEIPETARLLDLLDADTVEPDVVATAWQDRPRRTSALLGVCATGAYEVDLARDGPHVLIGGTTGSGKSELLQSFVASLALRNRPDELGFVLIDYKGGAAFGECAALPHTLGLVTDLDPHLTRRALASLDAELKRRELALRAVGAKDLSEHADRVGWAGPPLARLVLIVDEFKMIAEEQPAFLEGMVRIAALGRSLGVHLILATQRPNGVVTADIAANVNLRIALRVRDQLDSEDVIEARDAAAISELTPGRAYARSGSNPLVAFQSARVAGGPPAADEHIVIETLRLDKLGDPLPHNAIRPTSHAASDLTRIVTATREAARLVGARTVASPWLAPLPEQVQVSDLATAPGTWCASYGVVDLPVEQSQLTVGWDLAAGSHLAIVGMARSGRTTTLRTLAASIAMAFSPADVHVHAIDAGAGALLPLADLPHAGAVVGRDQVDRAVRLLDRLAEEIDRRQRCLAVAGVASLAEQRATARTEDRLPYVVVLIDGWESLAASWEQVDHGRPAETMMHLLREGPGAGVRIAISGDRGLVLSRMGSLLPERLLLRMADRTDLMMAGVPASAVPDRMPAGRALRSVDHAEVQVAVLGADGTGAATTTALRELAIRTTERYADVPGSRRAFRLEPLPSHVTVDRLAAGARVRGLDARPGWALVGAGGDDAGPVGLDLAGRAAIVAGPPRSGRSTTLVTMAGWAVAQGRPVLAVTCRDTPLTDVADASGQLVVLPHQDIGQLRERLRATSKALVVVDDAELLLDTEAESLLVSWLTDASRGTGSMIVAGASSELAGLYRGLAVSARASRTGVLLQPSSYADGDLFGLRLNQARPSDARPGRGLLIDAGTATPVQVARANGHLDEDDALPLGHRYP